MKAADQTTLVMNFASDIKNISTELVDLYGLKFSEEITTLNDPLFRWLDFRLRYIDPHPRKIIISKDFPKQLPIVVQNGLDLIIKKINSGKDLNPYQSKGLIQFNDTSGRNGKKRTDLMWADWGITHLHITDLKLDESTFFSQRACSNGESWLLFAIVLKDEIGLIDIRNHDDESFTDSEMLKIISENWPEYLAQFELKGILSPESEYSKTDIANARFKGLNLPVNLNQKIYLAPGIGITSASTSLKVTLAADRVMNGIRDLAEVINNPKNQFSKQMDELGIKNPEYRLDRSESGLIVYEKKSQYAFDFRNWALHVGGFVSQLHSLMTPEWLKKPEHYTHAK